MRPRVWSVLTAIVAGVGLACTEAPRTEPGPLVPEADAGTLDADTDADVDPDVDAGAMNPAPDAGSEPEPPPPDAGTGSDPPQPPPSDGSMPKLGEPIDRAGRAGINTLLTRAFDPDPRARDQARDRYNGLTPKDGSKVVADLLEALRIWDGLDRNCGNQFLSTPVTIDGRYERLASRFADDVLYLDSRSRDCWFYAGLETDEQGVVPNNDCGGRTLTEDAIDVTYALLVNGLRGPIRDGVARDDRVHSNETFPFVAPPDADSPGPQAPPPEDVVFEASTRSCKNLGYTDAGGGGGSGGFGSTCGASSHCAGENGLCLQNTCFYGGFCTVTCVDGDDKTCAHLGPNAACEWVAGEHACVTRCASAADCGRDGYACGPEGYCISQSP